MTYPLLQISRLLLRRSRHAGECAGRLFLTDMATRVRKRLREQVPHKEISSQLNILVFLQNVCTQVGRQEGRRRSETA